MSFEIVLMKNKSADNYVDKDVDEIVTLNGTLRSECSIVAPVVIVDAGIGDVRKCNYCKIDKFNRYYYVSDVVNIRTGIWEIHCNCDVLMTYKNEIRNCKGIVRRQQNKWNLYLNDGSLKHYQNPKVQTHYFPSGFSVQDFVLAVAGS